MSEFNVLIVDDDKIFIEILNQYLNKFSEIYNVLTAGTANEAIEILEKNKINLLVTNVKMADIDGLELMKTAYQKNSMIYVIIITSDTNIELACNALKQGAFCYIQKPFLPEIMHQSILKIIANKELSQNYNLSKKKIEEYAKQQKLLLTNLHENVMIKNISKMGNLLLNTKIDNTQFEYANNILSDSTILYYQFNNFAQSFIIKENEYELENATFNLRSVVDEIIILIRPIINKKGLNFTSIINKDVPAFITGDRRRLKIILTNLIINSINLTSQGEIVLKIQQDADLDDFIAIFFSVSETGSGIKEDKVENFINSSSYDISQETRQGLIVCKSLIEKMDGTINVKSKSGGTSFWFTAIFDKSIKSQDSNIEKPQKKQKVIIADKFEYNYLSIKQYFNSLNTGVHYSSTVSECHEMIKKSIEENDPFKICFIDKSAIEDNKDFFINCEHNQTKFIVFDTNSYQNNALLQKYEFISLIIKPFTYNDLNNCFFNYIYKTETENEKQTNKENDKNSVQNKILIVDDNELNIQVAKGFLHKYGLQIHEAANGKEAIEILKKMDFGIVFMDVQMPVMNGIDTTIAIRSPDSEVLNREVPIIAMTAHVKDKQREKCINSGMNDFISKPINANALKIIIDRFLKKQNNIIKTHSEEKKSEKSTNDFDKENIYEKTTSVFDKDDIYERFDGDEQFIKKTIKTFISGINDHIIEIKNAIDEQNYSNIKKFAHILKGNAGTISALSTREIAIELENHAKNEDIDKLKTNYKNLIVEYKKLKDEISNYFNT